MRGEVSATPAGLQIGRRFEGGRLAGDCQARAYEQLVPEAGRSEPGPAALNPTPGGEVHPITKEGAAA
jgi:hypothetical protein